MNKILYAVKSCVKHMNDYHHEAILSTWGRDVKRDLLFFVGGKIEGESDAPLVVNLDCPDDYDSLPFKTRAIFKYALNAGYTGIALFDTDTFVIPSKFEALHYWDYDYFGVIRKTPESVFPYVVVDRQGKRTAVPEARGWASGGLGYYVSDTLAKAIVEEEPNIWAEDHWVGQIAHRLWDEGKIEIHDSKNQENICTWHYPAYRTGKGYDSQSGWMEEMYKLHHDS